MKTIAAFGAAALLAASLLVPASAQDRRFDDAQRAEIGEIVREYLLENPEIMRDVFAELERRQAAAQEAAQRQTLEEEQETLFRSAHDVVLGNPDGDVTLVEFFDYNCGFCKRALVDILALVEADPELRVVLKEFPVLGQSSLEAAQISIAATGKLSPEDAAAFHVELLGTRGQIDGARALAVAQEMGLDPEALRAEMRSDRVRAVLTENMQLADRLGLTGTPAWVVGDGVIFGAVGQARLAEAVANTRTCGSMSC